VAAGHDIALVLTQPDRPAGRGLRAVPSAVKRLAVARGIDVYQPENFKSSQAINRVRAARPDALVVAAYGLILPPPLLEAAPHGALNIHASLLPRWRGAAPIQRAILAGDRETGISILQMDSGLDTGPVLVRERVAIEADDDAGTLHDKLAALGADTMVTVLQGLQSGALRAVPQPQEGVTYARKIEKKETRLDWTRSAVELERAVRAFRPASGAVTTLEGEAIKIWRARVVHTRLNPGALRQNEGELIVGCGEGALAVSELQRAGGKRLSAGEFGRGHPLRPGARFE
jgi:methionyl-tRNA formyltransferase